MHIAHHTYREIKEGPSSLIPKINLGGEGGGERNCAHSMFAPPAPKILGFIDKKTGYNWWNQGCTTAPWPAPSLVTSLMTSKRFARYVIHTERIFLHNSSLVGYIIQYTSPSLSLSVPPTLKRTNRCRATMYNIQYLHTYPTFLDKIGSYFS